MKKRKHFILAVFFFIASLPVANAQSALKGRVIFEGAPPAVETVEVKSDIPVCGNQKEVSKVKLGADQGVADAVVRVIGAKGTAEPKKAGFDQLQCEFVPHVLALSVGSTLTLTSSDAVLHNAHGFYEDGSTAFNLAVPVVGMEITKKLDKPGVIKIRCDAGHTWMSAYVIATEEPFYAVTDADGNFSIEGIPSGNYELEIWQEWLGKTKQPVEVKEGISEPMTIILKQLPGS